MQFPHLHGLSGNRTGSSGQHSRLITSAGGPHLLTPSPGRLQTHHEATDWGELSDEKTSPEQPPIMGIVAKLGTLSTFLVSLSLLLLAASVAFASWIWFGDRGQYLWRQVTLGPGNALFVTLTSAVIRFAIATLASITAAMMASIVVERHGVPADKIAHASVARYTGSLVTLTFGGYALSGWFRLLIPLQLFCAVASQFTSTLLFSDFGAVRLPGFTQATTVNYDFTIPQKSLESIASDGLPDELYAAARGTIPESDINGMLGWHTTHTPALFETFAEHAEPEKRIKDERVDDTGPVWRALLPIDSESVRTSISGYSGVAKVFDARTMCVRPEIKEFGISRDGDTIPARTEGLDSGNYPSWYGVITIDASLIPNLLGVNYSSTSSNKILEIPFKCPVLRPDYTRYVKDSTAPPISRLRFWEKCTTGSYADPQGPAVRVPSLDPMFYNMSGIFAANEEYLRDHPLDDPTDADDVSSQNFLSPLTQAREYRVGNSFLLMDADHLNRTSFPTGEDALSAMEFPVPVRSSSGEGPWLDFEGFLFANQTFDLPDDNKTRRADISIPLRATYCFDVMLPINAPIQYLNISATAPPPTTSNQNETSTRTEPRSIWNQLESKYILTNLKLQLGASPISNATTASPSTSTNSTSHLNRQILTLNPSTLLSAITTSIIPHPLNQTGPKERYFTPHLRTAIAFCQECGGGADYETAHPLWQTLFTEIVSETNSPALAIQAVNTLSARVAYMRWVSGFTESAPANMTSFIEVRVPVRAVGYAVVIGLMGVQLTLFALVGVGFARGTRFSMLENAWLVVEQVAKASSSTDLGSPGVDDDARGGTRQRRRFVLRQGGFRERHDGRYTDVIR